MPQQAIELFNQAGELNLQCPLRKGNIVHLPERGRVIIAGDLHGHQRNFDRLMRRADLDNNPDTHLILQEIIHGGPEDDYGGCLSYRLLLEALKIKLKYPNQIHLILGNHDTAAICNTSVLKAGKEMNLAFKTAMRRHYMAKFDDVENAMKAYLMTQPLAVRCANRIWVSHSLPADGYAEDFDIGIFERPYTLEDIQRPHLVYLLTWGRHQSKESLQKLAGKLDVDLFVLGHQPQEMGWTVVGDNTLIIATEHNHGCFLEFDLSHGYTLQELCDKIVPVASIL